MPNILNLRYSGSGQGRVFVNGFLVVNDLTGESASTRLEPYALPGQNLLRVESLAHPHTDLAAQVVVLSDQEGGGEWVLCQLRLPDPNSPDSAAQAVFELPGGTLPTWAWSQFQPAPQGTESGIYGLLSALSTRILSGPDEELLRLLQLKHTEIGMALGIGKDAMDQGLTRGLALRRSNPGFQIDLASQSDLLLVWAPDRRVVRALRKNGHDAIMIRNDGAWHGFEVVLGFNQGHWIVLR